MNNNEKVYNLVKEIPLGKVTTYGILAKKAGMNSPRLVGKILHNNPDPLTIPCHRVVNSKGELAKSFAFGGIKGQEEKLREEGIEVKNGRTDLIKYCSNPNVWGEN